MNEFAPRAPRSERFSAKAWGYSFELYDEHWELDKNVKLTLATVHQHLSGDILDGCLRALAYYAKNLSSSHSQNVAARFQHMLRTTGSSEINDVVLINYRGTLDAQTEWYLATIRGFLRRWYRLGYPGVSKDVIRLMDDWSLKGNRKGDAIKRKDPETGPLTDNELQAFNEGAIRAYESNLISLAELSLSLCASHTGRRPIQLSHLRIIDLLCGKNQKDEPYYLLNVPKAKDGQGFRGSFKSFALSEEIWSILTAQAKYVIATAERMLGFELQESDRQKLPIFPDFDEMEAITSPKEYRQSLQGDVLHIPSAEVTDTLQFIVLAANVKSERTGDLLSISARRFRYTIGTRAAREGFGELVIAELLDHKDTQNAGVYVKNIPEHVEKLDAAIGFQLAPYAQAFAGVLVDSERDAKRGNDSSSRIRDSIGKGIGTCGEHGFCGANVPIPCYTCMHFQPWLNGPHQEVYQDLLTERERVKEITNDMEVAAVLDRSIVAVADVIMRCNSRRAELNKGSALSND